MTTAFREALERRLEPLLLSADEAAQSLGISRRSLFTWTASGAIPVVKLGGRRLYDPRDLRQLIDKLKSGGTVDG